MLNTNIAPWPSYTEKEIEAVSEVLRSGKVNQWTGNKVREFEGKFANYLKVNHAIAVANGTVALDIIMACNSRRFKNREVIVTSRTFVASVSSIIMAGGYPVFVDVNKDTGNITPEAIKAAITEKTGAIMCVHLAGMPCDMDPIMELANQHGLFVIEDCAQAHGASYNGRKIGSIGHAAAWSFCQDKIMTTGGEGGMITTNNDDMYEAMWSYKDHGKNRSITSIAATPTNGTGFRYVHDAIGSNYRMTEMQAAIGLIQLETLDDQVMIRNRLSNEYDMAMVAFSAIRLGYTLDVNFTFTHAKYKHYAFVNQGGLKEGWTRDRLIEAFRAEGVPCYSGSCSEVYLEKGVKYGNFNPDRFEQKSRLEVAKRLGETSLMFLVHPTITPGQLRDMKLGIVKVLTEASKGIYA